MNDVVTRAAAEPISRASPLQRIWYPEIFFEKNLKSASTQKKTIFLLFAA